MREELKFILDDVKGKTAVDITVYDFLGELIASTCVDGVFPYKNIHTNEYNNGIFKDEKNDFTHFLINVQEYSQPLHGVLKGTGDMVSNYAYMVSSIIENAFRNYSPDIEKPEAIVALLRGNLTSATVNRYKKVYGIVDGKYYLYAIGVNVDNVGEVLNFLNSFSTSEYDVCQIMQEDVVVYIKHVDFQEEVTAGEIAVMLAENIKTELSIDVKVCTGSVVSGAEGFADSFDRALSGLRLCKTFGYPSNVFSYKEFIIINLLQELSSGVIAEYKRKLLDSSTVAVLEDADLTGTAEAFMNHSLNVSETARSLYIHRNTLMYRLDKIERDTGLNIRVFSDAVTFRILEILYRMDNKSK